MMPNTHYALAAASPVALNLLEAGDPADVLRILETAAEVELSPGARETALTILASLPSGAGVADFAAAMHAEEARQLGIAPDALTALGPLLRALQAMSQPGPHGRHFE